MEQSEHDTNPATDRGNINLFGRGCTFRIVTR